MDYFDLLEQDTTNPEVQFELYKSCLDGNGNGKVEAMEWLDRAAQSGHEEAQKILNKINKIQNNKDIQDFSDISSIELISLISTSYYAAKELYRRNKDSCNADGKISYLKDICKFEESTVEDYDNLLKEIILKEFETPITVDARLNKNGISLVRKVDNSIYDKKVEFAKIYDNAQELGSKNADKYFANFFTYNFEDYVLDNRFVFSADQLYKATSNYVSKSTYVNKFIFYLMLNSNKFSNIQNISIIKSVWEKELLNSPEAKNYPHIYEFLKDSEGKNLLPIGDDNFNILSSFVMNETCINDEIKAIAFAVSFSTYKYTFNNNRKNKKKLQTCKILLEKSNLINDSDFIYSLLCKYAYSAINGIITELKNETDPKKVILHRVSAFTKKNKNTLTTLAIVLIVIFSFFGFIFNSVSESKKIDLEDYIAKDNIYYVLDDNNEVHVESGPETLLSWDKIAEKCSVEKEIISNDFKCEYDTSKCLENGTIDYIVTWNFKEIEEKYNKEIDESNKIVITLNAIEDTSASFINLFDYIEVGFYGYDGNCEVELTANKSSQKLGNYTIQLISNDAIDTRSITNKSTNDASKNNELVYNIYKNSQVVATYIVYLETSTLNIINTDYYNLKSWYDISENSSIRLLAKAYESSDSSIKVADSKLITVPNLGELLTTQNSLSKSSYNKLLKLAKEAMKENNSYIKNIENVYLIENISTQDSNEYKTAIVFGSNDLGYKNDYVYICNPTIDENGNILNNDSSGIHFEYKDCYQTGSLSYAFKYSSVKTLG